MLKKLIICTLTFPIVCSIATAAENEPVSEINNHFFSYYQEKAQKIVKMMTLEEKIGQMTLVNISTIKNDSISSWDAIEKYNIGAILADANEMPETPSLNDWQAQMRVINTHTASTQHIPLLLGTDAVHGNQHVANAVIFPHNIGLGATHDASLLNQIAAWTSYDVKQSGFNWAYAPTVAVVHDYRWGRTYESFSSDPEWVKRFAKEYVLGAQNIDYEKHSLRGVLTSTKHFIGDGNTDNGIDEGNVTVSDENQFIRENYSGYEGALSAATGNIMISYSSINKIPMSLNKYYLDAYLFKRSDPSTQFEGFTVTDYGAIAKATHGRPYHEALANAVNAGTDMIMVSRDDFYSIDNDPALYDHSNKIASFQAALLYDCNLEDNNPFKITQQRIDEAVTRILQVKLAMGLFDASSQNMTPPTGDENKIALKAAEESLVLLKNEPKSNKSVIPVDNTIKHIFLLSPYNYSLYDDIGTQCGGWRIKWQGIPGNEYTDANASSVLNGIKKIIPADADILFNLPNSIDEYTEKNTIVIALLAEPPYAEFMGDVDNDDGNYEIHHAAELQNGLFTQFDRPTLNAIQTMKGKNIPIITVLLSGRPMIINHFPSTNYNISFDENNTPLAMSDAFIAAWLPGTKGGEAIANAIFGHYHFRSKKGANTLSVPWPSDINQVRTGRLVCNTIRRNNDPIPMFECGYGLAT